MYFLAHVVRYQDAQVSVSRERFMYTSSMFQRYLNAICYLKKEGRGRTANGNAARW